MIDLKSVVEKYPECLESATKFKSYMMDLYPDNSNKARIRILADIVDCGIALEIKNGKTDSISISNFCNTMENQYGYSTKLVEECVNQFLVAFGFSTNDTVTNTKPKKNNGVHKSSKKHTNTSADKLPSKEKNVKYVCNLSDFIILSNGWLKKYNGHDKHIAIPNSVTKIGNAAFSGCTSLSQVSIPDSVTEIDTAAFSGCTNLSQVSIPDSVRRIGPFAFDDCVSITRIAIPNSVTDIGMGAFKRCTNLSQVSIPDSVTNIGSSAFYECTNLKVVKLSKSIVSIADSSFLFCEKLIDITIPDSVADIGKLAFDGCYNLKTVYFHSEKQKNYLANRFAPNVKLIVKAE